jgi:hypothetical protein
MIAKGAPGIGARKRSIAISVSLTPNRIAPSMAAVAPG